MTLEEAIVEAIGGALTSGCPPQWESLVVAFVPSAAVDTASTGKIVPVAEIVSVIASFGVVPVAAVVHLST